MSTPSWCQRLSLLLITVVFSFQILTVTSQPLGEEDSLASHFLPTDFDNQADGSHFPDHHIVRRAVETCNKQNMDCSTTTIKCCETFTCKSKIIETPADCGTKYLKEKSKFLEGSEPAVEIDGKYGKCSMKVEKQCKSVV